MRVCRACGGEMSEEWADAERQSGAYYQCQECGAKEPPTVSDWREAYWESREYQLLVRKPRSQRRRRKWGGAKLPPLRPWYFR